MHVPEVVSEERGSGEAPKTEVTQVVLLFGVQRDVLAQAARVEALFAAVRAPTAALLPLLLFLDALGSYDCGLMSGASQGLITVRVWQ